MSKDEAFALSTREELAETTVQTPAPPAIFPPASHMEQVKPGFYLADRLTRELVAGPFERRFLAQQALAAEFDATLCAIVEFTAADGGWG